MAGRRLACDRTGEGDNMLGDTIRIRTRDERTALELALDRLARFNPALSHDQEQWEVVVETETDDDLPDLLGLLYEQLHSPERTIDLFYNGEPYRPSAGP